MGLYRRGRVASPSVMLVMLWASGVEDAALASLWLPTPPYHEHNQDIDATCVSLYPYSWSKMSRYWTVLLQQ